MRYLRKKRNLLAFTLHNGDAPILFKGDGVGAEIREQKVESREWRERREVGVRFT
jgi:hypothetical protein